MQPFTTSTSRNPFRCWLIFAGLLVATAGGNLASFAQDNRPVIINKLHEDHQKTRNIFRYPEFTAGSIVFRDNTTTAVRMNYNRLSGKILFIGPSGDTLEFGYPETFSMAIIGADSFYFSNGMYIEKMTHYPAFNLGSNQVLKLIGKEKKGAYGMYSSASSINATNTFTNNQMTGNITADVNAIFRLDFTYYISDRFNNFFPATKKNFYKLFSSHEKDIKAFAEAENINFHSREDLEKLTQFINRVQ